MADIWDPSSELAAVADGSVDSPAAAYAVLLARGAVARYGTSPTTSTWGIFSHEEVQRAAIDPITFSNVTVPAGTPRILPLMADPPEHTAYRRMVNRFFAPSAMREIEAQIRPIAAEMIDNMVAGSGSDFAQAFAYPFATRVLCRFLNVSEDWRIYNDWSSRMETLTGSGTADPEQELPAEHFAAIVPYLMTLIGQRRATPGEDIVTGIIQGDLDGERLPDEAVVGLIIALILAGRSTTASGIGNLVLRIAGDAVLQATLRAEPAKIVDAVEESLRLESPQQEMPRTALRDVEVGGQFIRQGDNVFLNWGSANVDPSRWADPGSFDLDRRPRQHFAFGRGIHQCFGAPLARMQMRVVVEELLARTSSIMLADRSSGRHGRACQLKRCRSRLYPQTAEVLSGVRASRHGQR